MRSSVTYVLGTDLEHLTLLGTTASNGTGNASSNRITGNSVTNRLEGLAGNDTLLEKSIASVSVPCTSG